MNFTNRPAAKTVSPTNHRFISRGGTRFSDAGRTMLCGLLLGGWLPAFANPVTFQVNLGVQRVLGNFNPQNGDTAVVSGNFSAPDWTTTSTLSPLAENPDIYAGTFPSDIAGGGTIQYKFIINPGGNSPANQLVWESGSNRSVPATGTDQTLPVVYFNNVTDANFIVVTQVTFQVNLAAQIESGAFNPATDFVTVAGDAVNNWNATASVLTNQPLAPHLWRGTFLVTNQVGTPVQYKFLTHRGPGDFTWEADGVGPDGAQNRSYLTVNRALTLPLVDFDNESAPVEFIAGADMSHLIFFEDRGITYRANGQVRDALEILRERGINLVRLRLFNSTDTQGQNNPYNYINNLNYNLPLAVRVKNAGLKFLLDFHYSDTWADPGKQTKPAAWTNLTFAELRTEIRAASAAMPSRRFAAVGAMPDYVQIGNEIIGGMLWDDGRVGGSFENNTAVVAVLPTAYQRHSRRPRCQRRADAEDHHSH
jgi:hypothetical protein